MASINTNAAANQARQALAAAQKELATSRTRIATGKAIASAKDNGAIHSIATMMTAERSGWTVANDSLARGQSLIATASAGLDAITDLLQKAREKAVAYRDTSLSAQAKASIRADIEALLHQVDRTAMLAEFDGKRPLVDMVTPTPSTPPASGTWLPITWTSGTVGGTFAGGGSGWDPGVGSWSGIVDGGPQAGQVLFNFKPDAPYDWKSAEVWQGGQRVAATGQAYVPGGNPVAPGVTTWDNWSGTDLKFDYDPSKGSALELRISGRSWTLENVSIEWSTSAPPPAPVAATYEFARSSSGDLESFESRPMTLDALSLGALDWTDASSLFAAIDQALGKAVNAASYYGERASSFDRLIEQNGRLADALESGVGNLVDADLGKESAKLQAGQIKESLATKALAIANAAPQWILTLFKG